MTSASQSIHFERFHKNPAGRLTNDGRWKYTWDAENRPIQMETTSAATDANHPYTKVQAVYDAMGRRIARSVWQGGSAASPLFKSSQRYLYDAWNVISEYQTQGGPDGPLVISKTYLWGLDLSNTPQGAGGVGGLLSISSIQDPLSPIYYPSSDGNGNITAWSQKTTPTPIARREYDAFGNTLVSEGQWPSHYGFSTKPQDPETGLYYYGYRYYDPVTGRWPSRDPIEEEGGVNLYGFVGNDGVNESDSDGRKIYTSEGDIYKNMVKDALIKLTGAEIEWIEESSNKFYLCQKKNGSTNIAGTLTEGIKSKIKIIITNNGPLDNANAGNSGSTRYVNINMQASVSLRVVNPSTPHPIYPHVKYYAAVKVSWAVLLWHELAGHAILGLDHPKESWNYWIKGLTKIPPTGYGVKEDPTITEENKARAVLGETARAPFYYGWERIPQL